MLGREFLNLSWDANWVCGYFICSLCIHMENFWFKFRSTWGAGEIRPGISSSNSSVKASQNWFCAAKPKNLMEKLKAMRILLL